MGYLVSRNFEDKVWLGADVEANFVVTGTHEQTTASNKTDDVVLNIKPYLAGHKRVDWLQVKIGMRLFISPTGKSHHCNFCKRSISSSSNLFRISLAGLPATIVYGAMSEPTTLFAPIMQ